MKQVAVVTGASRGIGKAIAEALSLDGYELALFSSKPHPPFFSLSVDVSDQKEVQKGFDAIVARFGRIDVLVNSAGVLEEGTSDLDPALFSRMVDINLKGLFYCAHAVAPIMKRQQSGYIFNLASRAGKTGLPSLGGYSASKFGVCGLSEALSKELAPEGIRVTALCPGWVDTDMAEAHSSLPSEKRIPVSDLIQTVRYLLSLSPKSAVKEVLIECMASVAAEPKSRLKKSSG